MGKLENARWEKFVQGVAKGKSNVRAYMAAYPDSSYESARPSSSELLANPLLQGRLEELRERIAEKERVSLGYLVNAAKLNLEKSLREKKILDENNEPIENSYGQKRYRYNGLVADMAIRTLAGLTGHAVATKVEHDGKLRVEGWEDIMIREAKEAEAKKEAK